MSDDSDIVFRFADFTLDLARGRLFQGQTDVVLRPKSSALLSFLARESGRVIAKNELMSALWPDVCVTEDSLTQCVHEVRQALGRDAAWMLRTVPKRGYIFNAMPQKAASPRDSSRFAMRGLDKTTAPPLPQTVAPLLRRDGIAIMPFTLTAGRPADAHVLDGLAHDVISCLARLRSFHVIARGSTFALRHLATDAQAAANALGVAYVLQGWATVESGMVRLRVDLVDAADGQVIWSDIISGQRVAHGLLVEDLADRLTLAILREISFVERNRSLIAPAESLDAWQSYHRGLYHMLQFTTEQSLLGRDFFQRAILLQPGFARALAGISYCHFLEAFMKPRDERQPQVAARQTG